VTASITPIDLGYLGRRDAAYAFAVRPDGPGNAAFLVECGPAACLDTLDAGLRAAGVDPASIRDVFLTHIHLDHAGSAGHWARRGATVHVHPFGGPHLADPAKLLASSRRVHGSAFDRWYGDLLPVPETSIDVVPDGGVRRLGSAALTAVATPGHARHHHTWILTIDDEPARRAFTGDVAGMLVPGTRFLSVPTPPPEFDPVAWDRSLERLAELSPTELWLTHGGEVSDPTAHLAELRRRLAAETELMLGLLERGDVDGGDLAGLAADYAAWLADLASGLRVPPEATDAFLGPTFCRMNLAGAARHRSVRSG
jgi:glyoxylase-like metal-dependent hydrolase (beta-lactamase superfamily II)